MQWDIDRLLKLPAATVPDSLRTRWSTLRGEVPDLPLMNDNGTQRLAFFSGSTPTSTTSNFENPELYAVFPYRIFSSAKPNAQLAVTSFGKRRFSQTHDWSQDAVWAACLGQTDLAWQFCSNYLKSDTVRYPAFWDGVDGLPQMCSGNVAALGLQNTCSCRPTATRSDYFPPGIKRGTSTSGCTDRTTRSSRRPCPAERSRGLPSGPWWKPAIGWPCKVNVPQLQGARTFRVSERFADYLIFYRRFENRIDILRVLHGARDLEGLFGQGDV